MAQQTNAALPDGIEIAGYRIVKKIASGGFSIVYLAYDEHNQPVAIKEYLPSNLALRNVGQLAPIIQQENLQSFRSGLKCFFEEGRALARIVHPNVVRVLNFFRANDTVYMVMAYESGMSLQQHILRNRENVRSVGAAEIVSERMTRRVFRHVMNGLREVHSNKMLHLDLKPANIYLRHDGTPIVLDFGAARQTLTADAPRLFPMYTPGFAAPELYQKNAQLGPWTDIYGVGACIFACMAGSPPQPSDARQQHDKMKAAFKALRGAYSDDLVDVVEWCLRLSPLERPQSVFALQRRLSSKVPEKKPTSLVGKVSQAFRQLVLRGRQRERMTEMGSRTLHTQATQNNTH